MVISFLRGLERLHTLPADVRVAPTALDMVASRRLLDRRPAVRTILNSSTVLVLVRLEGRVALVLLILVAAPALMVCVARAADAFQASGTHVPD